MVVHLLARNERRAGAVEEVEILMTDKGLVVACEDGTEYQLTIVRSRWIGQRPVPSASPRDPEPGFLVPNRASEQRNDCFLPILTRKRSLRSVGPSERTVSQP